MHSSISSFDLRRFVFRTTLFVALFTATFVATFFVTGVFARDSRMGSNRFKQLRLNSFSKPKIVLIGGSNLHYGVDSELLQQSLGMPVVNMGLQGSIGLKFMVRECEGAINEGDVVVLIPEHDLYFNDELDGGVALARLISVNPSQFNKLNYKQMFVLATNMGPAIKGNCHAFINELLRKKNGIASFVGQCNEYGDFEGHQGEKSIFRAGSVENEVVPLNQNVIKEIERFERSVTNNNAKLLVGFAPIAESTYDSGRAKLISEALKNFTTAGRIDEFVFPDNFFYDTKHHLAFDRRKERTELLSQKLIKILND